MLLNKFKDCPTHWDSFCTHHGSGDKLVCWVPHTIT